jgi:hypothetical protein
MKEQMLHPETGWDFPLIGIIVLQCIKVAVIIFICYHAVKLYRKLNKFLDQNIKKE